jgi:DNA replication and repair protein RecF
MYVRQLSLVDFRSYTEVELDLGPGVTAFVGPNGQGKTNLVEAVAFLATQRSHRVAADQALVRHGAERALLRSILCRGEREVRLELEINPGTTNRARVNRSLVNRARDALGILRAVVFAPEDLAIAKGDPAERRRFLDDLLVAQRPRLAGTRGDYDRVLRQRNTLLRSASTRFRGQADPAALGTLDVWDRHLADAGAELLSARLALVDALRPHIEVHYRRVAETVEKPAGGNDPTIAYVASGGTDLTGLGREHLRDLLVEQLSARRDDEIERGLTLVGPHRDELMLSLGALPVRGYASHGEAWSLTLALKLAAFEVLRADADDPVLILDDVFAELDDHRRARLGEVVGATEQVLVTAAVAADVPSTLVGERFDVHDGKVLRA